MKTNKQINGTIRRVCMHGAHSAHAHLNHIVLCFMFRLFAFIQVFVYVYVCDVLACACCRLEERAKKERKMAMKKDAANKVKQDFKN